MTIEERTIINLGVYVFQGEENRNGPGPQQRELFASRGIKELSEWEEVQASQWMVDLDIPDSLIPQR
ncbi:hypothetical protein ACFY1P_08010 [Streptomyces sp. NPDC001407]|uniref:hypothetical protein n=1 Tax=Streptomyces sp. NPDC001407 TaxID=3364573 RepID=UPI0036AF7123